MWRVGQKHRRSFCGPFSFVALAQRYATTSAVLVHDEEVIGYLLARRDGQTLRIVDFEARASDLPVALFWELLESVTGPEGELSHVEMPYEVDDRLRRVCDGGAANRLRLTEALARDALAKASPPSPSVGRFLGQDGNGAYPCAIA